MLAILAAVGVLACGIAAQAESTRPEAHATPQAGTSRISQEVTGPTDLGGAERNEPVGTARGLVGTLDELFAPRGVLSDVSRLIQKDNLAILGAGAVLGAAAIDDGDEGAQRFFSASSRLPGEVTGGLATAGKRQYMYPALIGTYVLGRALGKPGLRRTGAELTQALLLTDVLVGSAKHLSGRRRPDGNGSTSFPSGHTAGYFAIASVLQQEYGWKAGIPAYAVAAAMGASRLDSNRHFLSDVIAGAAIGIVVGRSVATRFERRGLRFVPVAGTRGGLGMGATFEFD